MNKVFKERVFKKKAFIAFLTAGDPTPEATVEFVLAMEQAGADLIEIGIPFSDPVAEGPVIQAADLRALSGGMTTDKVFDIVAEIRKASQVPLVFMTYLNPVFYYGYDRFFQRCQALSVSGIIIPDAPYEEHFEISDVANRYDVDVISMLAPTSEDRVKTIAKNAEGFLYLVSSMGVTGVRSEITTDLKSMVDAVRQVSDVPVAVGFGISTPQQACDMAAVSDGAIVGSAIVKLIAEHGSQATPHICDYVKSMKEGVNRAQAQAVR